MKLNKYVTLENNTLYFNNRKIGYINNGDLRINYKEYKLKNVYSLDFQEILKVNVILDFKNTIK